MRQAPAGLRCVLFDDGVRQRPQDPCRPRLVANQKSPYFRRRLSFLGRLIGRHELRLGLRLGLGNVALLGVGLLPNHDSYPGVPRDRRPARAAISSTSLDLSLRFRGDRGAVDRPTPSLHAERRGAAAGDRFETSRAMCPLRPGRKSTSLRQRSIVVQPRRSRPPTRSPSRQRRVLAESATAMSCTRCFAAAIAAGSARLIRRL